MIDAIADRVHLPELPPDADQASPGFRRHVPGRRHGECHRTGRIDPVGSDLARLAEPAALPDLDPVPDVVAVQRHIAIVLPALQRALYGHGVGSRAQYAARLVEGKGVGVVVVCNSLAITDLVAGAGGEILRHQGHLVIVVHVPEEGGAPAFCVLRRIEIVGRGAIRLVVTEIEMTGSADFACDHSKLVRNVQKASGLEHVVGDDRIVDTEFVGHVEQIAAQLEVIGIGSEHVAGHQ